METPYITMTYFWRFSYTTTWRALLWDVKKHNILTSCIIPQNSNVNEITVKTSTFTDRVSKRSGLLNNCKVHFKIYLPVNYECNF